MTAHKHDNDDLFARMPLWEKLALAAGFNLAVAVGVICLILH